MRLLCSVAGDICASGGGLVPGIFFLINSDSTDHSAPCSSSCIVRVTCMPSQHSCTLVQTAYRTQEDWNLRQLQWALPRAPPTECTTSFYNMTKQCILRRSKSLHGDTDCTRPSLTGQRLTAACH
jgi:hypothetical protein